MIGKLKEIISSICLGLGVAGKVVDKFHESDNINAISWFLILIGILLATKYKGKNRIYVCFKIICLVMLIILAIAYIVMFLMETFEK